MAINLNLICMNKKKPFCIINCMEIIDLHNDYLIEYKGNINLYLNKAKNNGVKLINSAIWTSELKNINFEKIYKICAKVNEHFQNLVIFSFEDIGFVNNEQILQQLIDFKPFCCSLTWNNTNCLASGTYCNGTISAWGKHVIKHLQNNNILIDTAHLNKESFFKLSKLTNQPLINTHTCFNGVFKHPRNLSNSQIKFIIETGGLIACTIVNDFLAPKISINNKKLKNYTNLINQNLQRCKKISSAHVAKHIAYFCEKFGTKNLCIGTDFNGTKNLPYDLKNYNDFPNLINAMQQIGFQQHEIEDILSNNFRKFYSKQNIK